jgi:aryl-alcohol dehydrogenase-like predicted oxidoreductase
MRPRPVASGTGRSAPMRYKVLGRSGLRVSEICLGTMTFGEEWGWGAPKQECSRMLKVYVDRGGNFIDTSVNYTNGTSEKIVGELVRGDRDHFVLATKYSLTTRPNDPNFGGNHRKNLVRSLKQSLESLGTDYVDLLWLHMWDFTTPVEEVMKSLDDFVRSGNVLHIGASDSPAWVVAMANGIAEARGWTPFTAIQVPYNLADRGAERDLIPMARTLNIPVTAWSPLAAGLLSGKYTRGKGRGRLLRPDWGISEEGRRVARLVDRLADELGRSSAGVALNWLRQRGVIPIVGATTVSQLVEDLGCLDFELNPTQASRLNEAARFELGFPQGFLTSDGVRRLIFGTTFPKIDLTRTA